MDAPAIKGLVGYFERPLDDKNRLVLPPEIRNRMDPEVVISRWYDRGLALFNESEYAKFAQGLHEQGSHDPANRLARREIFGGAALVGIDKQGRMSVPERLIEGFLLDREKDRDLVVIGDWNKALLFSGLRYREMNQAGRVNLDEALSKVEASAREAGVGQEEV